MHKNAGKCIATTYNHMHHIQTIYKPHINHIKIAYKSHTNRIKNAYTKRIKTHVNVQKRMETHETTSRFSEISPPVKIYLHSPFFLLMKVTNISTPSFVKYLPKFFQFHVILSYFYQLFGKFPPPFLFNIHPPFSFKNPDDYLHLPLPPGK